MTCARCSSPLLNQLQFDRGLCGMCLTGSHEDYSGAALVVFIRDGKVFENNDGHCSCNGLEHWDPEETLIGALRMRTGWPGLQEQLDLLDKEPTHA